MAENDLPTKKTLDDIEAFGLQFQNGYNAVKTLISQNYALAKKYIVISETYDDSGVRISYEFHSNLTMYTDEEKVVMLAYYDFLKDTNDKLSSFENYNGYAIYTLMYTRTKIDALIGATMAGVLIG